MSMGDSVVRGGGSGWKVGGKDERQRGGEPHRRGKKLSLSSEKRFTVGEKKKKTEDRHRTWKGGTTPLSKERLPL